ncbi:MAG: hypothetical protein JJU34_01805 [Lunatimonas sp.]|uniref:hypothetical protein n=1 Tax=Lunatimonas sp. TaxID=2060141 RepID=UPI00263A6B96|nr:hypothetical protein [Lunatimonas sp.]MCC5935992.1 hypothetical protein [Lunatimonas sp.]
MDAPLAVQFEYEYDCPLDGATSVRFVSTANGGREPFIYSWTFTNASIVTSNQPNPIVDFFQRGTAQLTLQDANGTTNTYYVDLPIPEALIISESTNVINSTNEENPDGGIELVLENIGSFSYAWSGPDDFFADEPAIYGLKDGVYTVTVTDEYECTFVYEFQLPAFVALPLSIDFVKLNYDESAGGVTMGWNVLDGNREYTYQIERSFGGIHDFSVVGHIASNSGGSVDGSYQFVDSAQHARDGRYYYRIKVVSVDGTKPVYISEIRMVQVSSKIGTETWDLYPNPVNGTNLYLLYRGGQLGDDRKAKIKVYSPSSGILLLLEGEIGLIDLSNSLSKMPKGLFFVEVQYGGKSEVFKVIR